MRNEKFYSFLEAVFSGLPNAQQMLSENPELITEKNGIGETVFHYVVIENALPEAKWLFENGSNINNQNDFGRTPLSEAACLGYQKMCEFLLSSGADPAIRDTYNGTALSEAAIKNEIDILKLMINYIDSEKVLNNFMDELEYEDLDQKSGESFTVLSEAGFVWNE